MHRSIALVMALFLTVLVLTGFDLAFESLYFGYYNSHHIIRAADPATAIRVVRQRDYGTMAQGVVITDGDRAQQLVFDVATGARVRLTEPGYPGTGFPFGWQAHQWAKSVHRGDFFGVMGQMVSLLSGLAMIYLSISGIVLYIAMWRKRAQSGRKTLFWK